MRICFFRHGPAALRGTPGLAEADRPLTPEGRKKTEQAARGLRKLDLGIDAIYTSPLVRAQQTAEILAKVLGLPQPKPLDLLLPGTSPKGLLDNVRKLKAYTPLLVGHEPLLSEAVSLAVCGSPKGALDLKKAGLAWVKVWKNTPHPEGSLRLLLTPSALRALGS